MRQDERSYNHDGKSAFKMEAIIFRNIFSKIVKKMETLTIVKSFIPKDTF